MATYGGDKDRNELSNNEIQGKLRELENGLDVLRRRYEQFFVGNRDRPPKNKRRQVSRLVRELERANMSNTSHKFKFRGLRQRYNTYKNKWNRVERQIEEGTYKPHQKRAQERMEDDEEEQPESEEEDDESAEDLQEDTDPEANPAPGDDAYELEVDADVDLDDFQRELEEMDREGEFEDYVETERVDVDPESGSESAPGDRSSASRSEDDHSTRRGTSPPDERERPAASRSDEGSSFEEERDTKRKKNLRKLQDKLGISKGSGRGGDEDMEDKRRKLNKVRERLEQHRSGGDDASGSGRGASNAGEEFDREDPESTEQLESLDARSSGRKGTDDRSGAGESRSSRGQTPPERGESHGPSRSQDRSGDGPRQARGTSQSQRKGSSRSGSSGRGSSDRGRSDSKSSRSSSSDDEEEGEIRRLYQRLIRAKEKCSQQTNHLTFEAVKRSLETERARISHRRRIDRDEISFRVVVKEGDAYFQANLNGT